MKNCEIVFLNLGECKYDKKVIKCNNLVLPYTFINFLEMLDIHLSCCGNCKFVYAFSEIEDLVHFYNFVFSYLVYVDFDNLFKIFNLDKDSEDYKVKLQKLVDNNFDFSFIKKMVGVK